MRICGPKCSSRGAGTDSDRHQLDVMALNSGKARAVIITVNYKSALATLEFLKTLSGTKGFSDVAVVIVDNSSGREDLSRIRDGVSQSLDVELLESVTNRGYFGAARFAFDTLM